MLTRQSSRERDCRYKNRQSDYISVMASSFAIGVGGVAYRSVMGLTRRLLRLREQIITVDDLTIPVWTREGHGDPILFIHGFGADKEGWLALIGKLRGRAIVALDLPGFGGASTIDPSRVTAPHQARVVKAVLDALGIAKVIVVGASMGGGISLRFASDFPDATRAVVLLGSVAPEADKSELGHLLDAGQNPLIPSSRAEFLGMLDFVAEKKLFVPGVIASYLASKQVARHEILTALFAAWRAQDSSALEDVLPSIKAPTLVIHGDRDRLIDLSSARLNAERVPNAKLIVLPGVGHVPQMEATARVAQEIKNLPN
jgi:pimeloyl-ACP methyl ester carboxylesterase